MVEFAMDILRILGQLAKGLIFLAQLGPRIKDGMSSKLWSMAERIDSGSYEESNSVQIAFDGQGNALAVSNEYYSVWAKFFTPGTGWGKPELIDHTRNSDNPGEEPRGRMNDPEFTFDTEGNAFVVWDWEKGYDDTLGFMHETWSNQYSQQSGWGEAERFQHTPGETRPVKIARDFQGNTLAIWTHLADNKTILWAKTYTSHAGWGQAAPIAQCSGNGTLMHTAFDKNGNALVLWRTDKEGKNTSGLFSVYIIYYSAVAGWGEMEIVSKVLSSFHMGTLDFAFDSSGNVIVACSFVDSTDSEKQTHIWAKRYDIIKGWEKAVKIDPGVISTYSNRVSESVQPKIEFDFRDHAIVVWTQVSENNQGQLWTNRYIPGKGWGRATAITKAQCDQSSHQLAIDTRGNAMTIWKQGNGLATSYYIVDTGWSAPEIIYPVTDFSYQSFSPKIVFDTEGSVIAIWWHQVFLYTTIWSRQFTPGKGWGKLTPVKRDYSNKANDPTISINTKGIAHVVWKQREFDSSNTHYWTSHLLKARDYTVNATN